MNMANQRRHPSLYATRRGTFILHLQSGWRLISGFTRRSTVRTETELSCRQETRRWSFLAVLSTWSRARLLESQKANRRHLRSSLSGGLIRETSVGIRAIITFTRQVACTTRARHRVFSHRI